MPKTLFPKSFNFLYFAGVAAFFPFLSLHYASLGLQGGQIGILMSIISVMGIFSSSLWAGWADLSGQPRRTFMVALVLTGFSAFLLTKFNTFVPIFIVMTIFSFCLAPLVAFLDSATLRALDGKSELYGRVRVWGSIGWIVGVLIWGRAVQSYGYRVGFTAFAVIFILCGFLSFGLPAPQNKNAESADYWSDLRTFLTNSEWQTLLFLILLSGIANSYANQYIGLQLQKLGATESVIGICLATATFSEIAIFFYGRAIQTRWSTYWLLIGSIFFYGLRFILLGWVMTVPLAWGTQLLHGLSFGMGWLALVNSADKFASSRLKTTAQSVMGVVLNIGGALGSLIGGYTYQKIGIGNTFYFAGGLMLVGLLMFALWRNYRK